MAATSSPRAQNLYMAKLAEEAKRYDEMVQFMEKVVEAAEELTIEERYLLSVAYKNVTGARRDSLRIISSMEQNLMQIRGKKGRRRVSRIRDYRAKIESELSSICEDIVKLLDSKLIGSASGGDSKVFYMNMKGKYYRYSAEFKSGSERKEAAENALSAYKAAQDVANRELAPAHPNRLGLALDFSVFYYEIQNSPYLACSLAKQAYEEAMADLDTMEETTYKDSIHIMQLIRDNLILWTSNMQDDSSEEIEEAHEGDDDE
ncbi:hypothetical protein L1987_65479 [Smallanthus sonchifolius]|uniref:Uncharacterized protein n=1 Tax=Smallanthus sonchifolius TaxID=185202 RepID=A0ACB9BUF3_9ASTR|nr:hypothetical protein L1987_65479 [Smallanthus sonchifolius]